MEDDEIAGLLPRRLPALENLEENGIEPFDDKGSDEKEAQPQAPGVAGDHAKSYPADQAGRKSKSQARARVIGPAIRSSSSQPSGVATRCKVSSIAWLPVWPFASGTGEQALVAGVNRRLGHRNEDEPPEADGQRGQYGEHQKGEAIDQKGHEVLQTG